MKTAEETLVDIQNMEDVERLKLLNKIYIMVNNANNKQSEVLINVQHEILKIKKDIEFLSGKIGLHDMYFNRIKKEKEEI